MNVFVHERRYVCLCVLLFMNVCMNSFVFYTYLHIRMYVCLYICVYVCVYVCMNELYIYIFIGLNAYLYL